MDYIDTNFIWLVHIVSYYLINIWIYMHTSNTIRKCAFVKVQKVEKYNPLMGKFLFFAGIIVTGLGFFSWILQSIEMAILMLDE